MVTINVSDDLWKTLHDNKIKASETFEDVMWRFIREDDNQKVNKLNSQEEKK